MFFSESDGKDEPVVGTMAKHMAATSPDDVVQFVKRFMGDPNWRFDSTSGQEYTAEEISAIILKRLKQDAEMALGEPVTDAVITVPAYFDDARRTATKQAGKMAGLNVMRVLNEPTAAAISYGLDSEQEGTVLVYDLGGGTFDVTVLRIENNRFEVLGTDGDRNLGGFDFDNALMNFVAEKVDKNLLDDVAATADLREKAEQAKRALSNVAKTSIFVTYQGSNHKVAVSRKDFEKMTESLLNRTRDLVEDVMEEANLTWSDIDHLLLIGGSTRMPMVREMMEKMSGKAPETNVNPDEAVALGAAVQAALEVANGAGSIDINGEEVSTTLPPTGTDIVIQDVTSQALGMLTVDDEHPGKMINSVLIPRNAKIPDSYSGEFSTIVDNQTELRVQVTQGDDPDPEFVTMLGESTLKIPPYPKGAPIRVTYHYDIDQTVQIEVTDLTSGQFLGSFEIDRAANLNDEEVAAATDKIGRLNVE